MNHKTINAYKHVKSACMLVYIGLVLTAPLAAKAQTSIVGPTPAPLNADADFVAKYCSASTITAIPAGSEEQARHYYQDLSSKIGFDINDPAAGANNAATTLDDLVKFLGYTARGTASPLTAKDLQDAAPAGLMDAAKLSQRLGGLPVGAGDVLVARFFAPKISDVSGPIVTSAGWRKLVRFRVLPGSPASSHGIRYGIVLFNFFALIGASDPFAGANSVNTQAILVGADERQTLYWLDFGETSGGAKLSYELDAFFDAGHLPKDVASGGKGKYFVPCSCAACHGALQLDLRQTPPAPDSHFHEALLDYLDTDHWQERVSPGDDFEGLKAPVLTDPGGFAAIQEFNSEVLQQNIAAQPLSMQRRAADHWLTWHLAHGEQREHLFDRSLHNPTGSALWNPADPIDAEVLPKLNRYCFRCHGTVLFDVLDKQMVVKETSKLFSVLRPRGPEGDPRVPMPPDRTLNPEELKRMRELILKLK